MKLKKQDYVELAESYRWRIEELERELRQAKDSITEHIRYQTHREFDEVTLSIHIDRRMTINDPDYVAKVVTRCVLEGIYGIHRDPKVDLRVHENTGQTISLL